MIEAGDPCAVVFRGCGFFNYPRLLLFDGDARNYSFEGCYNNAGQKAVIYERAAYSFLAGGLMFRPHGGGVMPERFSTKSTFAYTPDGASAGVTKYAEHQLSGRSVQLCAWIEDVRPSGEPDHRQLMPPLWSSVRKSALASVSLSGRTLTGAFTARPDHVFARYGPLPSDVVYDSGSGSVFFVRSRNGAAFTAELQNNYRISGGGFDARGFSTGGGVVTPLTPFSPSSDDLVFGNARIFLPEFLLGGDVSNTSPVISRAGRGDGEAAWIAADHQILPGDSICCDELGDGALVQQRARVEGVDVAARAIVLNGNGARAASDHPLGFFIRQPPANA